GLPLYSATMRTASSSGTPYAISSAACSPMVPRGRPPRPRASRSFSSVRPSLALVTYCTSTGIGISKPRPGPASASKWRCQSQPHASSTSTASGLSLSMAAPLAQRNDARSGGRRGEEAGPLLHQTAALLDQIAARIGCLGLVADGVRQGDLF